jgi:hypothetical protein
MKRNKKAVIHTNEALMMKRKLAEVLTRMRGVQKKLKTAVIIT